MQGDLIEMSGTMSGGGKPRTGRMAFLPTSHEDAMIAEEINMIYTQEDLVKVQE
jgi:hypothetical protein